MTTYRESYDDESHDRWIDRQLRRIPLPAGLLRRLRRIADSGEGSASERLPSDEALDAALRDVPLPQGFETRLRRLATTESSLFREERLGRQRLDDEKLDAALADVAVPDGLTDRLSAIADTNAEPLGQADSRSSAADRERQDRLAGNLRDVTVPSGMLERLSQIPSEDSAEVVPANTTTAEQAGSSGKVSTSQPTSKRRNSVTNRRRPKSSISWQSVGGMALSIGLLISLVYYGSQLVRPLPGGQTPSSDGSQVVDATDNDTTNNTDERTGINALADGDEKTPPTDNLVPHDDDESLFAGDIPMDNFWQPLPSEQPIDPESIDHILNEKTTPNYVVTGDPALGRPDLDVVSAPKWRGVRPPWVDARALTLQMQTGIHPFVAPAKHEEFRTRRLPLHAGRESYDDTFAGLPRQRLSGNQLARWRDHLASRVRTEDFINGVDYQYPPPRSPRRALALRTYGGTSPFGKGPVGNGPGRGRKMQLLQLGVQAASMQSDAHGPTHLVILVDTSLSMARNAHLSRVRHALRRITDSLKADDRITIVTTSYRPRGSAALIADAGVDDLSRLREAIATLAASPTQDVAGAVHVVHDIVRKSTSVPNARATVAWLTDGVDGIGEANPSWQKNVQDSLHELTLSTTAETTQEETSIDLRVVNVDEANDTEMAAGKQLGELLKDVQAATPSSLIRETATDSEAISWALRQSMAGQSLVVADDTSLEITFDPEVVAAYRLFGHEATTIVGHEPESLSIKMHAAQAVTVLFEVELKSSDSDTVATARLTWRDAETGRAAEQEQRISRWQFVPSFEESALPLQEATIAAATAESLRQSIYTTPANLSIDAVRRLALEVQPQVAENDSFERLMQLLRRAEEVGL